MQAGPADYQHMSDRELLLEMVGKIRSLDASHHNLKTSCASLKTSQESQQGTLQLISLLTHGLLSNTTAQLSLLADVRAHQIAHEVNQVGATGPSASVMPSAQGPSGQPASKPSKAGRLSLKRTQHWESRHLRRKHEQQTLQAQGQLPSQAAEPHSSSSAHASSATALASAAALDSTPMHAAPPDGAARASNTSAEHPGSAIVTNLQPLTLLRVGDGPSLAPGIDIPGTDIPPWQDLKRAAFTTIGGESTHCHKHHRLLLHS